MTSKTFATNFHFIVTSITIKGYAKRKLEKLRKKGIRRVKVKKRKA
jgi:hypothetical protein